MAFHMIDDGTLDTVVRCEACGFEARFNYASGYLADTGTSMRQFIEECCLDAEEDHLCPFDGAEQEQEN